MGYFVNVLDLFSGIGGFSLGLERAGFRTVGFCEIDPYCRAVLAERWPGVPIWEDVRQLSGQHLTARGISVDAICGGFPCQDLSVAGKGAGLRGERSGLWFEYARIIGEVRPRYVIVENVAVLLARGLDVILGDLAALGYDAEWHCIPASAVGAPHRRDRLWIVAHARRFDSDRGCGERRRSEEAGARDWPSRSSQHPEHVARSSTLANAGSGRCSGSEVRQMEQPGRAEAVGSSEALANPDNAGREQQWWGISVRAQLAAAECAGWWASEPAVGRMAHGIPNRVDRLHALGNAVVPQIPEIIGRAIMSRPFLHDERDGAPHD